MSDFGFEEEEFTTDFSGQTLWRILGLARPHWRWVLGFLFTIAVVSAVDSILTFITAKIIDDAILANDREALIRWVTLYAGLIFVSAAGVFGFIYLAGILGERIRYDMRRSLFNHLQELSLSYFDRTPVGWIISRVTSDTDRVAELVTWGLLDVTWGILNILTAMIFMVIINWRLALIVFAFLPVIVISAVKFHKRILTEFRLVRKINSKITGAFNESVTGVRVTKALGREEENLREFGGLTSDMFKAGYRAAWLSALFLPVVQLVSSFAIGAVVWFGGLEVLTGAMTIGGIQAFVSYILFMLWPIQEMARVYAEMQRALASGERVFSLMDSVPEISDKPDAFDPGSILGDIKFDHVDFHYKADSPILRDFSLSVERGETIALVGPTGGGKSTIVNLLARFYEPTGGVITIGGEDYTHFSLQAIHSRLGMVLQTPHLFSGTIRDNIRYGYLEADQSEVEQAAKIAGAHDFVVAMEEGYESEVGEGGVLLSVGQKQLISLARAVLADPEIFIMDEATSSVDTLTESLIQRGIEAMMTDRTSFIIAHRLSTIKRADRILVIREGQIAEMGSHLELLRLRGHYYRLYTQQFRRQLEKQYGVFGAPKPTPA
ncbi:MAG: ABC transporter ATP-binding protein [Chloroflexi bacterium]|nr:ABC transporter ATP-binding protein [Chloroflexota bacterium]MCI0771975.1 ABC transporter ATP-binding protein [Chloroflexota bacterium]MCI0805576.1 ABC transporter ATP-binding protein [Chloroflexota bacterium]MCI0826814.1 ABC transporter ATP-binding protein [Chloroflexota bacterium]MCI0853720.1 ABC transporter ATP-binding protein [Chloroflexota bacterium]